MNDPTVDEYGRGFVYVTGQRECQHHCVILTATHNVCEDCHAVIPWGKVEPDDSFEDMRRERDSALAALTETNQSLLDANLRIEWLERQLAKCTRSEQEPFFAGTVIWHSPEDESQRRALLKTPDLIDPRLGR